MAREIEQALESWCASGRRCIGQVVIEKAGDDLFVLCHRDDVGRNDLTISAMAEDAAEIAKFDDAGNYRPLKTAPNLRHGWRIQLATLRELHHALDLFYPGRLAMFLAYQKEEFATTPLRETLNRQSGMYRVAAKISDDQIHELVGDFCRSDGGCLRTIFGSAMRAEQSPRQNCHPKNSILYSIKRDAANQAFRCFVRKRAICS